MPFYPSVGKLDEWDWPESSQYHDGYTTEYKPELTRPNFLMLIDKVNELVAAYNELAEGMSSDAEVC